MNVNSRSRKLSSRYKDIAAVTLLAVLVLVFFWRYLRGQVSFPWDILGTHYPLFFLQADAFRNDALPLWDPYIYGGNPNISNIQAAIFYPINFIICLLAAISNNLGFRVVEYQLILHFFLAGLFMYLFSRSNNLEVFGSLVSAITYMFGGFFVSQVQHLGVESAAAWIPLIFLLLQKAFRTRSLVYGVLSGIPIAFHILAGHGPSSTVLIIVLSFYFVYTQCQNYRKHTGLKGIVRLLGIFVLAFSLGLALSAVQTLPTLELLPHSIMEGRTYEQATRAPFSLQSLMTFFVPNFLSGNSGLATYWGTGDITKTYHYIGIFPLILAVLAVLFVNKKRIGLFIALGAFSFLWYLGHYTFVSEIVYLLVPSILRRGIEIFPIKAYFDFAMATLAGFGASFLLGFLSTANRSRLTRFSKLLLWLSLGSMLTLLFIWGAVLLHLYFASGPRSQEYLHFTDVFEGVVLFTLLLAFSASLVFSRAKSFCSRRTTMALVILLIVFDLFTFGAVKKFNAAGEDPDFWVGPNYVDGGKTGVIAFLQKDTDYFRVYMDPKTLGGIWANGSRIWKLQNVGGAEPILLQDYSKFLSLFCSSEDGGRMFSIRSLNSKLLDLLNLKYLVATKSLMEIDPAVDESRFELVFDNYYKIYRNKTYLPRAFIVHQIRELEGGEQVLTELDSPLFSPREVVLLEKEPSQPLSSEMDRMAIPRSFWIEGENFLAQVGMKGIDAKPAASGQRCLGNGWGQNSEDYAAYAIDIPNSMPRASLYFRYAKGSPGSASFDIYVDGKLIGTSPTVSLHPTAGWGEENSHWEYADVHLGSLSEGEHQVEIQSVRTSPDNAVNVDGFLIAEGPPTVGEGLVAPGHDDVQITEYRLNSITLDASLDADGFLVTSEIHYPGWKAYVDGGESRIYKANYVFRAVYLTPGSHTIVFKYEPLSFKIGLCVSLLALLFIGAFIAGNARTKSRARK
jgi:hypothetical protein